MTAPTKPKPPTAPAEGKAPTPPKPPKASIDIDTDVIAEAVAEALNLDVDVVDVEDDNGVITVTTDRPDGEVVTVHKIGPEGVTSEGDDDKQIGAVEKALKGKAPALEKPPAPKPPAVSIKASADGVMEFEMPILVIEGSWTGDWRYISPQSLTWRDLPLPVMALTSTTATHDGAQLVGQLTSVERHEFEEGTIDGRTGLPYAPGTTYLSGRGRFDTSETAAETQRLVREGFLRGVSVDIGDAISEIAMVDKNGNDIPKEENDDDWDLFDLLFGFTAADHPEDHVHEDEDETPDSQVFFGEKIIGGRLMGATICPFPAFEGAYVTIGETAMSASAFNSQERGAGVVYVPTSERMNAIVAAGGPLKPPSKWFSNPNLGEPTAISVSEDGRVCGHLASWSECHVGYQNSCVKAPHSSSDYAYYKVGCVLTDDGSEIPTGTITMNTGHAELWQGADSAKAHYDNTGFVVADVCCGEDEFGIWVAGALRPDVDELTVRRLRGAALSGDWRVIGGRLELVAALAVNVPGFPITRPKSRVASGAPMSLVAAGSMTDADAKKLRKVMKTKATQNIRDDNDIRAITYVLDRQARQALRSEVHPRVSKR
jgi:hypothetical protein